MLFFRLGSYLLILTCCFHLFGHFSMAPTNENESQLFEMMQSTQLDLGNGKSITMMSLYKGMSLCFSLLFLWTGALSLFLSYKIKDKALLRRVSIFNSGALSIGSGISLHYFFFAPSSCFIVCLLLFSIASWRLK